MSTASDNDGPLQITAKRITEQLGQLIPQIHLTLVSVLQGVALVYLVTAFASQPPKRLDLAAIRDALIQHHLYLPHVVSFMLIIIAWNEFAYAQFFLHWPLTALSTTLQFLFALAEVAAFSAVDSVGVWLIWLGVAAGTGAVIRARNTGIMDPRIFATSEVAQFWARRNTAWHFRLMGVLFPAIGIARALGAFGLAQSIGVFQWSIVPFDYVAPGMLIVLGVIVMRTDDFNFVRWTNAFLRTAKPQLYEIGKRGNIVPKDGPSPESV